MRKKAPLLDGEAPDEEYQLDKDSDLQLLGLPRPAFWRIADEYNHYPSCKHAVIEHKSKNLRDSIVQLESTARHLATVGKNVEVTVIVAERISHTEAKFYRKGKDNKLYDRRRGVAVQIRPGNHLVDVLIFYVHEVNKMWDNHSSRLDRYFKVA